MGLVILIRISAKCDFRLSSTPLVAIRKPEATIDSKIKIFILLKA